MDRDTQRWLHSTVGLPCDQRLYTAAGPEMGVSGERALQGALLIQAVLDLRTYPPDHPLHRDAAYWLEAASEQPFGAAFACAIWNLDLDAVRRAAYASRRYRTGFRRVEGRRAGPPRRPRQRAA